MDWPSIILATFLISVGIAAMVLTAVVLRKIFFQFSPAESSVAKENDLPQEIERNMRSEAVVGARKIISKNILFILSRA